MCGGVGGLAHGNTPVRVCVCLCVCGGGGGVGGIGQLDIVHKHEGICDCP